MKRTQVFLTTGLLVMSAAAVWLMTRSEQEPSSKVPAPSLPRPAVSVVAPPQAQAPLPMQPDVGVENEAASDLQRITIMLRDYRTIAGDNPIGSNAEIMQALSGDNPRQAKILPEDLPLNSSGELVDRWGTPYFFHQLSRNSMEIRSAGADRRMWTRDDIFTR
ncbi:MAG: hypothetical protein K9N47_13330 [Prosthecobacter sp.]|uniref:hypothetical protein n=1 Tax=Prosthecobacter sp. TaxID=1965333 RepID=UPI0025EA5CD1|nr:hypothetical protein [Prosthecobacter sp.]MCF7787102.1 hypothetical protein [Prosthecobacter sp.]